MTNLSGGVRSTMVDMTKLQQALGSGGPRGKVDPRLFHLRGYACGVMADIIGPSSRHEATRNDDNVSGTAAAWEHGDSDGGEDDQWLSGSNRSAT